MQTAFVKIWGELVGAIAWDEVAGIATFEYDSNFKKLNWDLAPLKMPIQLNKNIFSFPDLKRDKNSDFDIFKGMPGLLADTLPNKYGNQLM